MPPTTLILISPLSRIAVPIRQPEEWDGQTCFHCQRRIEDERNVFLVNRRDDESPVLTCRRCVGATHPDLCLWCGRPGSPRSTGDLFCQPCWAIYVTHVADLVEGDTEEKRLLRHVKEELRADPDPEAPPPAD